MASDADSAVDFLRRASSANAAKALSALSGLTVVLSSEEACSAVVAHGGGTQLLLRLVRGGRADASASAVNVLLSIGLSRVKANRAFQLDSPNTTATKSNVGLNLLKRKK